jgi:hypothetical protein
MQKTLVDSASQWNHVVKNTPASELGRVYIKQELALEFHHWAIKQSMLDGFKYGLGLGLVIAVILAVFTKLMVM